MGSDRTVMLKVDRKKRSARLPRETAALVAALAAACVFGGLASCATVEQRPGVTSVNGAYQRYFEAAPDEVLDAAMATYEELGLLVQGRNSGEAVARTDQGVVVATRAVAEGRLTRARVRVTPGYDETLSTAILVGIGDRVNPR